MTRKKNALILLAGGSGTRMGSDKPKQFMELNGKPLIWYSLNAAQKSDLIDEIVIVGSPEHFNELRNITDRFGFDKVSHIVGGGAERYLSVINGVKGLFESGTGCETFSGSPEVILVHDSARPFLTDEIIIRCLEGVGKTGACVAAVPSKDTVKLADEDGMVTEEPPRKNVWNMQTPQVFDAKLLKKACDLALKELQKCSASKSEMPAITDDAQMVRLFTDNPVKLVMGSYENIKVTTPVDMLIAEKILENGGKSGHIS
jgi:2-C-methyl-D-erythritol 4-phosphate cytidylyltransferase